jgi:histone deacetylase complex regulatory component SIN3
MEFLDRIKTHYRHSPEVYQTFLDLMGEYINGVMDYPELTDAVSHLFSDSEKLRAAFSIFTPLAPSPAKREVIGGFYRPLRDVEISCTAPVAFEHKTVASTGSLGIESSTLKRKSSSVVDCSDDQGDTSPSTVNPTKKPKLSQTS